jgi:hypothetical protein
MRSISLLLLLSLIGCTKWSDKKATNEVLITVENECYCKITFYKNDTTFYTSDYWDCTETKALYLQIKPGEYRVEADNGFKEIERHFSKDLYNSSLSIEFP